MSIKHCGDVSHFWKEMGFLKTEVKWPIMTQVFSKNKNGKL